MCIDHFQFHSKPSEAKCVLARDLETKMKSITTQNCPNYSIINTKSLFCYAVEMLSSAKV